MKKPTASNQALDTAHYGPEIVRMMDETENCLCCGVRLKYLLNKGKARNRGYCSLKCYYQYPPKLAYACMEYGKDPQELLCVLLNRHTVQAAADLMGVGRQQLYEYMRKYGIQKKVVYTWKGV